VGGLVSLAFEVWDRTVEGAGPVRCVLTMLTLETRVLNGG